MSIVKLSNGGLPIRNDGEVFFASKGRTYLRQVVRPHIDLSIEQRPPLAAMAQDDQDWRGLTAAQQAAWTAASLYPNGPAMLCHTGMNARRQGNPLPGAILVPWVGILQVTFTRLWFQGNLLLCNYVMTYPTPVPSAPDQAAKSGISWYATPLAFPGIKPKKKNVKHFWNSGGPGPATAGLWATYTIKFGKLPRRQIRIVAKPWCSVYPLVGADTTATVPPGVGAQ